MLKHLNGSDPLMLEYSYFIFLKQSQISRIHMMLQQLFPEFLTMHLYVNTNPCPKLLMLLPQNQIGFP